MQDVIRDNFDRPPLSENALVGSPRKTRPAVNVGRGPQRPAPSHAFAPKIKLDIRWEIVQNSRSITSSDVQRTFGRLNF